MSDPIKKLKEDVSKITLSEKERKTLTKEFFTFMDQHQPSLKPEKPIKSGFTFPYFTFARYGFVAIILLGVVLRAEASIPGELLYPVKINVNEPVVELLAFSEEAKAEVSIKFTKKRLNEIVHLIAENKVEKEHVETIQTQINTYNEDVLDFVDSSAEAGDNATAIEISSEMKSVLSANKKILNAVTETFDASPEISALNTSLNTYQDKIISQSTVLEIESKLDFSSNEERIEAAEIVEENQSEAEEALTEIVDIVDTKLSSTTIQTIKDLIQEGKEKTEAENFDEAFLLFERAKQIANEATIISESQEIFEKTVNE